MRKINKELDPTLAWNTSCEHAQCGSCSVVINGRPMLACELLVENAVSLFGTTTFTIEPIRVAPVLRDLVVDLEKAYDIDLSIPYAAGALYSTVEDLYTWEQSLSTEQLVPQKYLDEMCAPQAAIEGSEGISYGYGWFIGLEAVHPYMRHTGGIQGFSSIITRHPQEQLTIILLSNQENSNVSFLREVIFKKLMDSP